MSISPRFLDELRSRLTLSEIIGRRVTVKRAGRESKACCPFHHEKTPSFTINDDKHFFHCFGCGAHGDSIGFVMRYDNLSFMDAIEMLAAEAGLQVPQQTAHEVEKSRQEKDIYSLLEDSTQFFQAMLREARNKDALTYLQKRGLSPETMEAFRVGFAPEDPQALRKHLVSKGHKDRDMIAAGVVKPSAKGGEPYAFFRDRVMFPVPDRRGRVVAFGGRILPEHLRPPQRSDFTPPKYINSAETEVFHKGSMLYGEPHARRAAADDERLVVVEGYLDVIACVQAGIRGAVAPMGTALTEGQIISLWKMIPGHEKMPVLCFDGDNAGRKAAVRVCQYILPLLEPGRSVAFAFMPDGEDPDSLIRAGGVVQFNRVLDSAISLFDFIWDTHMAGRDTKTPEMRAGVIKTLENEVSRISNRDVQVHYSSLLRRKISEHFFPRKEFGKWQGKGDRPSFGLRPKSPQNQQKRIVPRVLMASILNHPHIFAEVEEIFGGIVIQEAKLSRLRQEIMKELSADSLLSREKLVERLKNSGFTEEIDDILSESVYVHASFCSPLASEGNIASQFAQYLKDISAIRLGKEVQEGWKRAFQNSDEEEEKKLRAVVSLKAAENEG